MAKSISDLSEIIKIFSEDRGWQNNDPNQLITSLIIEVGELAEHFQWKNSFEDMTTEEKEALGYEFVDVIFYLLRLAEKSGINIEEYFDKKLPKLENKFPIGQTAEDHKKVKQEYRRSGRNRLYN
jgi:NTP pyrophosphatase (non-canonical NTP hydrolase)